MLGRDWSCEGCAAKPLADVINSSGKIREECFNPGMSNLPGLEGLVGDRSQW